MQSKQSIVTINESCLTLHTGLSSRQFANAKMGQYTTEPGIFVSIQNDEFTIEDFRFTDTKTIAKSNSDEVVLTNDSIEGTTLLSLLENKSENTLKLLETLSSFIEWSFENDIDVPNCGPEGTIITEKGILFLPFELFERSILSQNKDTASLLYGCWINNALSHVDSWRFTLSAYLYTVLSGEKPYLEIDREKRSADYYDSNFIPLHLLVNTDSDVAKIINHNLSLTAKAHTSIKPQKQKTKTDVIAAKLRESSPKPEISSLSLPAKIHTITTEKANESIQKEKAHFIEKKAKQLRKARFLRKNKTKIAVVALILVSVGFVAGSIIQSNLSKPTTEGMTEEQVVQTFYKAFNTLDNVTLDSCGKSSALKNYSNMIASLYVSSKMRETYEQTAPFLPPAQWIGTDNPTSLSVFGLTNVEIQNNGAAIQTPQKGDTAYFTVNFYTMVNHGLQQYDVSYTTDTLTLEYGKKQWQIVSLETDTRTQTVNSEQFIEELNITRTLIKEDSEIEVHEQGTILTETLRETYPWLPTAQEVKASVELIPVYLLDK